MRVNEKNRTLIIRDEPVYIWLIWIFSFLFVCSGVLCLLVLLFHTAPMPIMGKLGLLVIGFGHLMAGIYIIYSSPKTNVAIDLANERIVIKHIGLFRNVTLVRDIKDIESPFIVETTDADNDTMYQIQLKMRDGSSIPLTLVWYSAKESSQEVANKIKSLLSQGGT